MNQWLSCAAVALAITAGAWPAEGRSASSFQCENMWRVKTGDHITSVTSNCGQPDFSNQRTDKRRIKHKYKRWVSPVDSVEEEQTEEIEIQVDELVYDFGPNRFVQHLTFENGVLVRIFGRWSPGSR